MKSKYKTYLNNLETVIGYKPTHADISKILEKNNIEVSANALSNRLFKDGFLSDEEVKALDNYYKTDKNLITQEAEEIDDCLNLPILGEVTASMGNGIEVYNESRTGFLRISAKVLKDIGANPGTSDVIIAEGDSMEPTIQGGSTLIVDKSRTEVKDGKIYCINFNGALMAKRLQLLPPKKLRVISDNFNKYPAWDVDFQQEIDFSFKVVGEVMRWMTNAR